MTTLSIIPKLFLACFRQLNCRTPIKIEFLPDKVKMTNPGNIYNSGTIEDIKNGIQSFRNPSLVILLNKLGYIENYGTGIQRILEAYQGAEHQPEFYVRKVISWFHCIV